MKVYEIMSRSVKTIPAQATVTETARKMKETNIGFLPVLDGFNKPIGVVTDRDLALRTLADGIGRSAPIKDAMSPVRYALRQDEDLRTALDIMKTRKVSRLLVTDNGGALVGIVSLHDLAMAYDGGTQTALVHAALRSRVPAPSPKAAAM